MDLAFRRAVAEARRYGDLYFASLLPEDRILNAFGMARWLWQGWVYTPAVTIWVFLEQCLSADHSCRDAVAGLIAWRLARGQKACSANTGAYCTARDDVPEEVCSQWMRETGRQVEIDARDGPPSGRRSARGVALAGTSCPRRGRLDVHDARHGDESGRVSADVLSKARLRLSHRA